MSNYDTPLALAIVALALTWWVATAIGKWRTKRRTTANTQASHQAYADTASDIDVDVDVDGEFARLVAPLDEPVYDHEREGL